MAPRATTVKTIPWRLVLEVATVAVNRFRDDLQPDDRRRLTTLVTEAAPETGERPALREESA